MHIDGQCPIFSIYIRWERNFQILFIGQNKGGGGFDKDGKGIFEFYGFGKKYMYRA